MSDTPAAPLAGRPAAEQYLARILPLIPAEVRQRPGSAAFRRALYEIAEQTGILPSRRETARAMRSLTGQTDTTTPAATR